MYSYHNLTHVLFWKWYLRRPSSIWTPRNFVLQTLVRMNSSIEDCSILAMNTAGEWASCSKMTHICCKCSSTQSTVQPVPTKHRLHVCIKMRTALLANTKTWPNVVSMLVQRPWRLANSETALGQILAFAGLHTRVCLALVGLRRWIVYSRYPATEINCAQFGVKSQFADLPAV